MVKSVPSFESGRKLEAPFAEIVIPDQVKKPYRKYPDYRVCFHSANSERCPSASEVELTDRKTERNLLAFGEFVT